VQARVGGTFHSLAHRVLRENADLMGFERTFTVLDRSDMEDAIQSILQKSRWTRGREVSETGHPGQHPEQGRQSPVALERLMVEEYSQFLEHVPQVEKLGRRYKEFKGKNQLMDYDDLILLFRDLLTNHEEVGGASGSGTATSWWMSIRTRIPFRPTLSAGLPQGHRNVMVVGDDSQSIYSFRGASYRNMFEFPKNVPGREDHQAGGELPIHQPILTFTNVLMGQAREKYTKCLFTRRGDGEPPRAIDTRTEPEQALFVCRGIQEELSRGRSVRDVAVLFRAAYHSFEVEVELARRGIPFVKYGGFKFMESAHIKDLLAHLRVVANKEDGISWGRILRMVKDIGPARSQAITSWLREGDRTPWEVGEWPGPGKGDEGLKRLSGLLRRLSEPDVTPQEAVELAVQYYEPS